jgi:hypothetical protein
LRLDRDMWNGLNMDNMLDFKIMEPNIFGCGDLEYYNSGNLNYTLTF